MYCVVKGFYRVRVFCLFVVMAVEGGVYKVFIGGSQMVRGSLMRTSCVWVCMGLCGGLGHGGGIDLGRWTVGESLAVTARDSQVGLSI